MNLETVAGQYDTCDVLTYVMNISLDCCKQDLRSLCAFIILAHIRLKNGYCISHHLG